MADLMQPKTMGEGDLHCDPACTYLQPDAAKSACGVCKRDGKPLDYYDFYLAHCKGQTDSTEQ